MLDRVDLITKATQLRKQLGEDSSSPIDIFAIVQSLDKLTLVFYPMSANLSGMCIKSKKENSVIAINSTMTLGRQRFSLAHELYHLFFDDTMISVCAKSFALGGEEERKADAFASYFLMPPAELETKAKSLAEKNTNKKLTLDDIIRIEQYFGISHQATVIGLKSCKYMNPDDVEDFLITGVRRRAEAMGYSPNLYLPLPDNQQYKTYGYYIDQTQKVFEMGLVSSGKYEELLLDAFRDDLVYGDDEGGDLID